MQITIVAERRAMSRKPWAGDGAHPGVHLFFVLQEVAQGGLAQHLVDGDLPRRARGSARAIQERVQMGAWPEWSAQNLLFEEAAAQGADDVGR